jgi:hypothetical protein
MFLQWDGYGTGLKDTAAVAAEEGHSVGVLYNDEVAAAASVSPRPVSAQQLMVRNASVVAACLMVPVWRTCMSTVHYAA